MKLRIYPDVHEPGTWCVDQGTNATERRFERVFFLGKSGITGHNPQADNEREPKYWIAVRGRLLSIRHMAAIV